MTIQQVIREVQRMIGDSSGAIVSKEFLLQMINEEAQRVSARFPSTVRLSYTTVASSTSYPLTSVFGGECYMKIRKVFVNGSQLEMVSADLIERLIEDES
jgi:hypothetical protein